jgi:N-acetylglutamate synthase-like GNAT family acetyltransferase
MNIRKALPADRRRVDAFVGKHAMDYTGTERDEFLLAEDDGRLAGVVALRKHPDCLELCALCVDPADRGAGVGRLLVEGLVRMAGGTVYLATVIPRFFEKCGFVRTLAVPGGMKKDAAWCEGCDKTLCTIMIKEVL